jgi:DNA-binding beta-propeller fold protein YncE
MIPVGMQPVGVAVASDGKRAYVTNFASSHLELKFVSLYDCSFT